MMDHRGRKGTRQKHFGWVALAALGVAVLALAWASAAPAVQGWSDPGDKPTPQFVPSPTGTPLPTWPALPSRPPVAVWPTPVAVPITGTPGLEGSVTPTPTIPIPTPVPDIRASVRTINLLLLGSDRREDEHSGRADAIILAIIFPDVPAVSLLSIPRDLFVFVPGRGMSRINTADAYGGAELLKATLRYNLGLRVDYYIRTDFDGFKRIVDALGGIDVSVDCHLEDWRADPQAPGGYAPFALEPGIRHMDGDLALWYVRSRYTTTAFDRDRRQRKVLRAAWQQALRLDVIPKVPELWNALHDAVQTDLGLTDVIRLAAIGARLDSGRIKSRAISESDGTVWTTPDHQWVLLPNWERIEPVLRDAFTPAPPVERVSVPVEVWNGTQVADWPLVAADRLAEEGFAAILSDADRRDYAQTIIIDFSSNNAWLQRLRQLFHVAPGQVIRQPAPGSPIPYRLIIGRDFNVCASSSVPLLLTPTPTATP